jgi:hypothetical protein
VFIPSSYKIWFIFQNVYHHSQKWFDLIKLEKKIITKEEEINKKKIEFFFQHLEQNKKKLTFQIHDNIFKDFYLLIQFFLLPLSSFAEIENYVESNT